MGFFCKKSDFSVALMTINMNGIGGSTEDRRKSICTAINECLPDIVFSQEISAPKSPQWRLEVFGYDFCNTEKEAGVAWKTATFRFERRVETSDKNKVLSKMSVSFSEFSSRTCVIILRHIASRRLTLCLSWHGPHYKTNLGKKKSIFQEFLDFADALSTQCDVHDVLIGGDFNLASSETLTKKGLQVLSDKPTAIDYFVHRGLELTSVKRYEYSENKGNLDHQPITAMGMCKKINECTPERGMKIDSLERHRKHTFLTQIQPMPTEPRSYDGTRSSTCSIHSYDDARSSSSIGKTSPISTGYTSSKHVAKKNTSQQLLEVDLTPSEPIQEFLIFAPNEDLHKTGLQCALSDFHQPLSPPKLADLACQSIQPIQTASNFATVSPLSQLTADAPDTEQLAFERKITKEIQSMNTDLSTELRLPNSQSKLEPSMSSSVVCCHCGLAFRYEQLLTTHVRKVHTHVKKRLKQTDECSLLQPATEATLGTTQYSPVSITSSAVCSACGKKCKNQHGLAIHKGKMHKSR